MAFWQHIPKNPQEHAQKQIQELSNALVKSVKQVERSYPNSQASARIQQEYQRKVAKVLAEQRKYERALADARSKQYRKERKKLLGSDDFRCGTFGPPF
jgi:DNA-binding transcriptional regulator GbsR (MarR family)